MILPVYSIQLIQISLSSPFEHVEDPFEGDQRQLQPHERVEEHEHVAIEAEADHQQNRTGGRLAHQILAEGDEEQGEQKHQEGYQKDVVVLDEQAHHLALENVLPGLLQLGRLADPLSGHHCRQHLRLHFQLMSVDLSSGPHHKAIEGVGQVDCSCQEEDQQGHQPGHFKRQNRVEVAAQDEGEVGSNLEGVDGDGPVDRGDVSTDPVQNLIIDLLGQFGEEGRGHLLKTEDEGQVEEERSQQLSSQTQKQQGVQLGGQQVVEDLVAVVPTGEKQQERKENQQPVPLANRSRKPLGQHAQLNASRLSTCPSSPDHSLLHFQQSLSALLAPLTLVVGSSSGQQVDDSSAGVHYLGVEVHRYHQAGDGAADEVDQNQDGVLVVLQEGAVRDQKDVDVEEQWKNQTDRFAEDLCQQETAIGAQLPFSLQQHLFLIIGADIGPQPSILLHHIAPIRIVGHQISSDLAEHPPYHQAHKQRVRLCLKKVASQQEEEDHQLGEVEERGEGRVYHVGEKVAVVLDDVDQLAVRGGAGGREVEDRPVKSSEQLKSQTGVEVVAEQVDSSPSQLVSHHQQQHHSQNRPILSQQPPDQVVDDPGASDSEGQAHREQKEAQYKFWHVDLSQTLQKVICRGYMRYFGVFEGQEG